MCPRRADRVSARVGAAAGHTSLHGRPAVGPLNRYDPDHGCPRPSAAGGRRPPATGAVDHLSRGQRLSRQHRAERRGDAGAPGRHRGGSDRARPDAARRGRPLAVPRPARARHRADPDSHADGARRGDRPHRRPGDGRGRLPDQALRVARAAGAHPRRTAAHPHAAAEPPADAGRGGARLRRLAARHARAPPGRRARHADLAHRRRVSAAARAARPPAPCADARPAAEPDAGTRRRRLRPLDRLADLTPAPAPARGRARAALHQDRASRSPTARRSTSCSSHWPGCRRGPASPCWPRSSRRCSS